MRGLRSWATQNRKAAWIIGGVVAFVAVVGIGAAIEGPEKDKGSTTAEAPAAKLSPVAEWHEEIKSAIPNDDSPSIKCAGQEFCGISYDMGELVGIDTDFELVDAQRDVWEVLFSNPKFKSGFIELEAPTESVGGKDLGSSPILRVRCDRAANRLIDWEAVDADGLKQLCRWDELVEF